MTLTEQKQQRKLKSNTWRYSAFRNIYTHGKKVKHTQHFLAIYKDITVLAKAEHCDV
jgi:hypothetical protein